MPPPYSPLDEEIGRSVAAEMAAGSMAGGMFADPGQTARANEIARRVGLHPVAVEADIDGMAARDRLQRARVRAQSNPTYARMMSNPRFAPVAMADEGMFPLAEALRQTIQLGTQLRGSTSLTPPRGGGPMAWAGSALTTVGNVFQAAGAGAGRALSGLARGTAETVQAVDPFDWLGRQITGGPSVYEPGIQRLERIGRYYGTEQQRVQTDTGNWWANQALRGVESVPTQVVALLAAARGQPGQAVGILSSLSGGEAYATAREAGVPVGRSLSFAGSQAGFEAAGEMIPILRYMDDALRGSGFFKTLAGQLVTENIGEQFTGHLQDFNTWATIEGNRGKTFEEFLAERPGAALEIAISTTAAVGLQTSAARGIQRLAEGAMERAESRQASRNVDRVMATAAGSSTRTSNPTDFEEVLGQQLDGLPGENLFIPAETIRTLHQDPADLAEDPFWGAYAEQIDEAEALGGDVVVPLSAAATHLAGTPQWEAIKDQVRASPGGWSRSEMKEAEAAFADAAQKTGEELAALLEDQRAHMEPVQKVYEAMRDKLMLAGFTPDAASQMATQFAQRQRVRAERLGRDLTGEEAGAIEVRQVLPENLATVIKAAEVPDAGLSAVITEMKRDRGARSERARFGPSLLDWIVAQGGIEDRGGDIAAMGAIQIKKGRAKAGQRRLIRPHEDEAQGMLVNVGQGKANTQDYLALRAWEEGFFPEFAERPSVNDLQEAIAEGLAGRHRFAKAEETDEDNLRKAAQELFEILDQQGLDPTTASTAEITRALSQFQAARTEGRGFAQREISENEREYATNRAIGEYADENMLDVLQVGRQIATDQNLADEIERRADRIFEQSFMEGPRGRITFTTEGKSVIDLFEARDLSTFVHETGHLYLEELKADAELALQMETDEARQLFADWETVKAWFKREGHEIGEDGVIPTEAHELFARGFERFAMEGKAPSSALKRAFEAFRSWLLTIYKVVDNLKAPITPEIRDVMARLLATDEEIQAAAEEQQIKALFNTAEEAGMTEAEFGAYRTATEEARGEAYDALLYRTMATIRASRTKEYKEREATVKAEVMAEVDDQPVFRALRLLRNGRIADEEPQPTKLSRQWLIDVYGKDALDLMPRSVPPIYGDKNTVDPDMIAEQTGFASGDELIRTLMGHEMARQELKGKGDKRSPRQAQIDQMTADRMAERYGDPLRDGSIEEEARAAIHNDRQGEVIASEIRALARRTGKRPAPYAIARKWAAEKIAAGEVREVASGSALQQYQRAARKAGKAAEAAMLKGDVDETYRQKQAQMLNNALISEGKKAKERVDVAVRRLSRIARRRTSATISQDYLDQAHMLLESVDLKPRTLREVERIRSFAEWAGEQRAAGHDVAVPDNFADLIAKTHWSKLSVEELIGLDDTIKQIMHLGRLKQTLLDGQERRAFEEVVAEMQAAGDRFRNKPPPNALNDPDRSAWQGVKSRLRGADAALVKIEQLVDWLDGGNPNGVFNRIIFRPLAEAQGREADQMRTYVEKVNAAIDAMPKKQLRDWNRRVETPELINRIPDHPLNGEPWSFYKDQVVMMALNMGNEGNRQRLMDGYGWSEAQVRNVLDRLMTAEDWRFVQTIWDTIDGLWPDIEALEKRVNGFAPEKVEATPVETPFGTFRGGYFPAIYDPQWSTRAEDHAETDLLEKGYTRANVRASATKERAERVKRPILLNMAVITRHLGEVIHDITHREALTETWKVVSDERVQRAVSNTMGPEYAGLLKPWLKHIANDQARNANSNDTLVKLFRHLGNSVTIVGLGFRFTSTVAQIAGLPNVIAQIGERRVAEGWARFIANPVSAYREVTTKSAEMRDRFSTMDRDIVERAQQQSRRRGIRAITGPSWFTKYAFHGILIMDSVLTTAGWIGAYRKASAEGMSEAEAVYYADKVVRKSQGAGGAKDQAAIMREHEAVKVFAKFFSYFSALYNQQRDFAHRLRRVSGFKDFGRIAHFGFWAVVMPPLVDDFIRAAIKGELPASGDDEDDDGWFKWAATRILFGNLASIPGVRDIGGAIDRDFGYKVTPISNIGEGLVQGWNNIERLIDRDPGTEPSSRWLSQTLTTIGLLTARPTGQIAATSQFGYDWATGEEEPQTAQEVLEGATSGRIER